jgi:hypothetical protein
MYNMFSAGGVIMEMIGLAMLATLFSGIFVVIAKDIGIKDTVIGLVIVLAAASWIIIGIELATGGESIVHILKSLVSK